MSSNENLPSLLLSDIMHPMSPSPAPGEDQIPPPMDDDQQRYDPDAQQEPLTDSEVLLVRNRLQELGLVMSYGSQDEDLPIPRLSVSNHLNPRERELTNMILRLTSYPRIDRAQLEEQATTISTLATQRDYLIAEAEEERLKLKSERENWNRTAEALLTQKTRPLKTEDVDTQRAEYEAENKSLREKLHDRHRRLSALEQDILRLKPLLLMQPYSNQQLKQSLATQSYAIKTQDKGKRREVDATPSKVTPPNVIRSESPQKFDSTVYPYGYQYKPEISIPSSQSSNSHTFLLEGPPAPGPSSQRRRSKDHSNNQKGKKQKHCRSTTMSSDAYPEHVLLAAQRIGRKRTALVTGLQRLADREKDALAREHDQHQSRKEQERLEKERLERLASGTPSMAYYRPPDDSSPHKDAGLTPTGSRTPKRGGYPFVQHQNANPGGVNTPSPSNYVFVNTSASHMSRLPASYSPGSTLNTPTMRLTQTANPPTPLDSLVDAARMMGESSNRSNSRRHLPEEPESPMAKRRKVSTDKVLVNRGASKLGRVKSGLDVLADQAAAVNKPDQSSTQPSDNDSQTISDKKGKAKANAQPTKIEWNTLPKSRNSTRTIRPSSRRLFTNEGLPSTSSAALGRGMTRTQRSRRTMTPEPRVIAVPIVASSGFDSSEVRVGLNLRPVSGWGDRPVPDEDEEDSNSDSTCDSPTRNGLQNEPPSLRLSSARDPKTLEVDNAPMPAASPGKQQVLAVPAPLRAAHHNLDPAPVDGYDEERNTLTRTPDSPDVTPQAPTQSNVRPLVTGKSEASQSESTMERSVSQPPPQPIRQLSLEPVQGDHRGSGENAADAPETDADEDEDAEGEEDEENTENDAEVGSRDHPSRFRSPPPPDPSGNDKGPGPNDEQDPDADADGDMDVDEKGTPPSGTDPAAQHTQGGRHRQTVIAEIGSSISIKPFTVSTQCLAASSKQLSCTQREYRSIRSCIVSATVISHQ